MRTAWLNIILFAGALNALAVLACATGKIGPIGAAFTHQLSSFLVMMNSLRLLRVERSATSPWRFTGWFKHWVAAPPLAAAWDGLRQIDPAKAFFSLVARRRQMVKPALLAAAALIVVNGFYAIQPDEVGVIERFGRKVTPFSDPGLHYKLPWPVDPADAHPGAPRARGGDRLPLQFRAKRRRRTRRLRVECATPHRAL
jgi:hypothetical protein